MEAHVEEIFTKITQHLASCTRVADVKRYLYEMVKSLHHTSSGNITQWETVSRRITNQANTHLHTLTFKQHCVTITYHYLFDLSSYATILVAIHKNSPQRQVSVRKALFLYDCKNQRILELDSESV